MYQSTSLGGEDDIVLYTDYLYRVYVMLCYVILCLLCYAMVGCCVVPCPKNFSAQSDPVSFCASDNKKDL